jgi:hypothetical protein
MRRVAFEALPCFEVPGHKGSSMRDEQQKTWKGREGYLSLA